MLKLLWAFPVKKRSKLVRQQDALVQGRVWIWEGIAARAEMLSRPGTLLVDGGEEARRRSRSNSRRKWGVLQKLKE